MPLKRRGGSVSVNAMIRVFCYFLLAPVVVGQSFNDYDLPPHDYYNAPLTDPMSKLLKRLHAGELALEEPSGKPLVERLLVELDIPVSSQILVFTKTSLQRRAVHPGNPRAIYFNEEVYLGWMPNGRIEITSIDPNLGGVFYFQRPLDEPERPLFAREERCLGCHAGSATNFLPGLLGMSVFPDADGRNLRSVPSFDRVSHDAPFEDRWGGWFLTGHTGSVKHMANVLAKGSRRDPVLQPDGRENKASLQEFFDLDLHLRPDSDVLALLIHDHQIGMHYCFLEALYRVRQGLYDAKIDDDSRHALTRLRPNDVADIGACVDRLMRYLLFADEVSLGDESWQDGGDYRAAFLKDRRPDQKGRALKDLRLAGRLFEHRCSYMIYSQSFAALPRPLREEVYFRLHTILTTDVEAFDHLSGSEKQAIHEILTETLPEARDYWANL